MRSLVIPVITKRLARSSTASGQSMLHSCYCGYLEIPLYHPLHSLGFRNVCSNGIFSGGNNLYEESRVCKMGVLRAVSMEAIATGKTADEDEEQADSSEGLPDNLYRRISMLGDPKYSAVAVLEGWIKEGKKRPKNRDLRRMAMELRKHSRHKHALESQKMRESYSQRGLRSLKRSMEY